LDRARTFAPPSAERKSGWPKPPVPPVKKGVRPPSPFAPARALVPEWKGYLVGPPRGPFGGIGKVALRTAVAGTLDWVAKAVRAASAAKPRKRGNAPLRRRRVRGKRGPSGLLCFPVVNPSESGPSPKTSGKGERGSLCRCCVLRPKNSNPLETEPVAVARAWDELRVAVKS